jgi:hypothetical protein
MNQKQLANVLTKILGLSLCTQSAMHIVTGILNALAAVGTTGMLRSYAWGNLLSAAVLAAIGTGLIVQSRLVVDKMFKDE